MNYELRSRVCHLPPITFSSFARSAIVVYSQFAAFKLLLEANIAAKKEATGML